MKYVLAFWALIFVIYWRSCRGRIEDPREWFLREGMPVGVLSLVALMLFWYLLGRASR